MKNTNISFAGKILLAASLAGLVSLAGCEKYAEGPAPTIGQANVSADAYGQPGIHYVANEVLVKFKAGTSDVGKANALAKAGGQVAETILTKAMERAGETEPLLLVHTPLAVADAIASLKGEQIAYAEPNYLYTYNAATNDSYVANGSLWGMDGNIYGSQASTAWANKHTGSASVVLGVIDEGIQFDHPDLAGQVWTNPYDPIDGKDNDNNGYIDDIHGWDFDGNNNTIYDGGTSGGLDDHGTHVSGTIGAKANNSQGVAGMNWSTTLISCKFLGRRGGTLANAVKAVDYLTNLKTLHSMNIVASNNSWGGGYSQRL
ncbi:MAG: hypothetical protein NVSMB30_14770 [Hymenobacter sp.]